jgi:FkbM family methyltransferase
MFYWIVMPILSGPLRGRWFGLFTGSRFVLGRYGGREAALLAEITRPGDVVFDLGAHVGYLTLLAAKAAGEKGRVFAFEPSPLNLVFLGHHVRLNRLANVRLMPCAVGRTVGRRAFDTARGSGRGGLKNGGAAGAEPMVEVVGLDEMVHAGRLPRPDVIKMDIEGAEAEALRSAEWIFTNARPKLLLSTHGDAVRAECKALLAGWGYGLSPMTESDFLATPL